MVRTINRDIISLQMKSENAALEDASVVDDLLDTLAAHSHECVGMAANMIGVHKNIIAVTVGKLNLIMINPVITKKTGAYATEEGCLSLEGQRKCTRYKSIEVTYLDKNFKKRKASYSGWTAQIIQHECDHLNGIII